MTDRNQQQIPNTTSDQQDGLVEQVNPDDISEQANIDEHDNIGTGGEYGTPASESGATDQDPYANLGSEDLYSNRISDPYHGNQDLYDDTSLFDDQDPQNTQHNQQMRDQYDQTDLNDPDAPDDDQTAGGEGLYGEAEDLASNNSTLPVPPGSDQDQYGTRGSQDQYGYQQ